MKTLVCKPEFVNYIVEKRKMGKFVGCHDANKHCCSSIDDEKGDAEKGEAVSDRSHRETYHVDPAIPILFALDTANPICKSMS